MANQPNQMTQEGVNPQQGQQTPPGYAKDTQFTEDIKKHAANNQSNANNYTNLLNNLSRRLRILEDRYGTLRRKTLLTDQNMLSNSKRLTQELKLLNEQLKEARKDIYDMKGKMGLFVKELETCAQSEDLMVIENYVNLWSPIKFVSTKEARDIVKQIIREVMDGSTPFAESKTFNKSNEQDSLASTSKEEVVNNRRIS